MDYKLNQIVDKYQYSEHVFGLDIYAPEIALNRKAGHFVILRADDKGERIPLTIANADLERKTIHIVVQVVGLSSAKIAALKIGDIVHDLVGPLGTPTHIEHYGTVLCAGGGVGVAPLFPIVQAMKACGNRVVTVLAAKSKELIIMENEMRKYSDQVIIMTDDGSYGTKGLVTQGMEQVLKTEKVDHAVVIGPVIMMKFAALKTKEYNVPTISSLNTLMLDGTGMCGACRCTVDGKTRFVCVEGPEFDAHAVDFDEIMKRHNAYKTEEIRMYEAYNKTL